MYCRWLLHDPNMVLRSNYVPYTNVWENIELTYQKCTCNNNTIDVLQVVVT
jgi:hypothetical protein